MDIPALSINMANAKLAQNFQINIVKKAIELIEQTGEQLLEIMKMAEIPTDCTIDIKM